ncbi:methyltransferase like 4 [Haematobia irritans]|uniref:methyltransferase like 4 n=1 Tax=Haematobia irritans TaxID=7368 RepID=UPI003F4FCFD4
MQRINVETGTILLLNHCELIKSLYTEHESTQLYSLKEELFDFKPKCTENMESKPKNKRKRKAQEMESENSTKLVEMLAPLLPKLQSLIRTIPEKEYDGLHRFWEESSEFPQFHGANNTDKFQTTHFNGKTFLIPPKCNFYNYNIEQIPQLLPELDKYDIIVLDFPWQNKYIKRLKRVKQSLGYQMLDNDSLRKIPIDQMFHKFSLVVLWCTNAIQHQRVVLEEFLPNWNLKLVHSLKWFKFNTKGELISPVKAEGYKQPYESLFIACPQERDIKELQGIQDIDFIASIPSIIHSHKPPLIDWLKEFLNDPLDFKGLELFARYLQPQFTSIGLEVLKLMDERLYNKIANEKS